MSKVVVTQSIRMCSRGSDTSKTYIQGIIRDILHIESAKDKILEVDPNLECMAIHQSTDKMLAL